MKSYVWLTCSDSVQNAHMMKWMMCSAELTRMADQDDNIRHDAVNEVHKKNQMFSKSMVNSQKT